METSSCLGTKLFIAKDETFPVKRTPVGWNTLVRVLSDVQLCIQSECRGFDRYASFRADSACEMKETATILLQFCLRQPTTVPKTPFWTRHSREIQFYPTVMYRDPHQVVLCECIRLYLHLFWYVFSLWSGVVASDGT